MHRGLWNMDHASFFSEATLIEIDVYTLCRLNDQNWLERVRVGRLKINLETSLMGQRLSPRQASLYGVAPEFA